MLEAGGADAVVAAMRAHADAAAVQQEGCSALGNMAGGDLLSQRAVLAAGGAAAAAAALGGAHGGSAVVAAQACGALGNLAGGDDACQRGALAAGAAAVVAALVAHADAPTVQQGGRAAQQGQKTCPDLWLPAQPPACLCLLTRGVGWGEGGRKLPRGRWREVSAALRCLLT